MKNLSNNRNKRVIMFFGTSFLGAKTDNWFVNLRGFGPVKGTTKVN